MYYVTLQLDQVGFLKQVLLPIVFLSFAVQYYLLQKVDSFFLKNELYAFCPLVPMCIL